MYASHANIQLCQSILFMLSRVVDHDEAVRTAQTHGSGDDSLFSSALSHVHQNKVRRTAAIRHVNETYLDLAS